MSAVNKLTYNGKVFERIRSIRTTQTESLSLSTLPIDTLKAVVIDETLTNRILATEGYALSYGGYLIAARLSEHGLDEYQYGEPVLYYHDSQLRGRFYVENIIKQGKIDWCFNCVSDIGLLETSNHYGGIYNGTKASALIAEVINGIIPYTLDETLAETELYGWLPKGTRRANLRDILFAIGGTVQRAENGTLMIVPYGELDPYELEVRTFYRDGGSVTDGTPATQAVVVEHAFAIRDTDEEVTLFDGEAQGDNIVTPNGSSVYGMIVDFSEPMHDLSITGATIIESGVNYAVISSTAYASLVGKKYTHTQRSLIRNSDVKSAVPNVVTVDTCYLISSRNSVNVADRVIAFYGYAKKVTTDLVLTNQKPGDFVSFTDPYGDKRTGFIESLNTTASKVLKANASIMCNFKPPYNRIQYLHYKFFFANDTWVVPEDVVAVRVVLIGGGPGGASGVQGGGNSAGQRWSVGPHVTSGSGTNKYNNYGIGIGPGAGGKGGAGSPGAQGGKVYSTTITVTPGQSFSIVIGEGGEGGVCAGAGAVAGANGTPSTFGSYSSESGQVIPNGYLEEITQVTYAGSGDDGVAGGDGVSGATESYNNTFWGDTGYRYIYTVPSGIVFNGVTYLPGQYQETKVYNSGSYGNVNSSQGEVSYGTGYGLGGGPAAGVNGNDATNRSGASGATPITPPAQTKPGYGGHGGHGGGGSGGPGGMDYDIRRHQDYSGSNPSPSASPINAIGGNGGTGGKGGPGAVFIYWYSYEKPEEGEAS